MEKNTTFPGVTEARLAAWRIRGGGMAWNAFHHQQWLRIVGLCCHSISDETVQDVQYGYDNWVSALFWIQLP